MVTLLAVKEDVTVAAAVELPLQLPMCLAYDLTYNLTCVVLSFSTKKMIEVTDTWVVTVSGGRFGNVFMPGMYYVWICLIIFRYVCICLYMFGYVLKCFEMFG